MASIEGLDVTELNGTRYRNPRDALRGSGIKGLDVTELSNRPTMQPQAVAGTAYGRQAGVQDIASMKQELGQTNRVQPAAAQGAVSRATRAAGAVRGAIPAIVGGAAFQGIGSALADNSQGPPAVAQAGPGQIPINPAAEYPAPQAVPGNVFRDTEVGRNVGNALNAVGGASAAAGLLRGGASMANTLREGSVAGRVAAQGANITQGIAGANALPPVTAPNISLPAPSVAPPRTADPNIGPPYNPNAAGKVAPAAAAPGEPAGGIIYKDGNSYSGKNISGDVQQITDRGVVRDARGGILSGGTATPVAGQGTNGIGGRSVMDIEQRALEIERQNSAIRQQMDAYGPGAHNADGSGGVAGFGGYGDRLARQNAETAAASMRIDARSRSGQAGAEMMSEANRIQNAPAAEQMARDGLAAKGSAAALDAATTRRGQDIGLQERQGAQKGLVDVAGINRASAKDVAEIGSEGRVSAAEARANNATRYQPFNLPDQIGPDGFTVIKGGQAVINTATGEIKSPADVVGEKKGAAAAPKAGDVMLRADGKTKVRFKGGDPKDPKNYEPV